MLTADYYCSILQSHCAIEVAEFFGPAGAQDFVYMQDGASAHRSNRAQALCGELFPSFITKAQWPPNSPDLNPLDFYVWGAAQRTINAMAPQPSNLVELQVAVRKAISSIPISTMRRAIDSFYTRCRLCVDQNGATFKHVLKSAAAKAIALPPRADDAVNNQPDDGSIVDEPVLLDDIADMGEEVEEGEISEDEVWGGEGHLERISL